ncbi:DNA-3-methyladenine glycosylase I [Rosenbergiella australiborealis]|uniref:DNA-3-methyladenine glycosylase I n=1 Tax=Rosenbergiella australiborealis TaxID=1544696 RepID=A0ABS5T4T9_9GAMM|nr:DNA-3-methyladenine glycosylase I [Rosenbergiella australiborealis]MBT0727372.1 DNA-3-methyladenine glycosylase I [Rosenbergiella australiborealis]
MTKHRCGWVTNDPDYLAYHDHEWGVPCFDRQRLFEMLCLEGQQAGLAWITVLKKREAYREAFYHFEPEKVAQISPDQMKVLLQSPTLIRNQLKIASIISNAQALLAMEANGEDFVEMIWQTVAHQPIHQSYTDYREAPVSSPHSQLLSNTLKKRGFKFIGPIICHAYMQACGLIIDHQVNCFKYSETNNSRS